MKRALATLVLAAALVACSGTSDKDATDPKPTTTTVAIDAKTKDACETELKTTKTAAAAYAAQNGVHPKTTKDLVGGWLRAAPTNYELTGTGTVAPTYRLTAAGTTRGCPAP